MVVEENPLHDLGVDRAVVAAPGLLVRLDQRFGDTAQRGLPGDAVAVVVGDEEVGDHVRVELAIDLLARQHASHRIISVLGVLHGDELLFQLVLQRVVLGAGIDDAVRLAALQIDVDLAEAHGVGARARPVDVLPELSLVEEHLHVARLDLHAGLERHVAVDDQPGVVVHRFAE